MTNTYVDATSRKHYGRVPCLEDEKSIQVLGNKGYFCAPECEDGPDYPAPYVCPENPYDPEVSNKYAFGWCVAQDPDNGKRYCGLICGSTNACPSGMHCGGAHICAWPNEEVPPPPPPEPPITPTPPPELYDNLFYACVDENCEQKLDICFANDECAEMLDNCYCHNYDQDCLKNCFAPHLGNQAAQDLFVCSGNEGCFTLVPPNRTIERFEMGGCSAKGTVGDDVVNASYDLPPCASCSEVNGDVVGTCDASAAQTIDCYCPDRPEYVCICETGVCNREYSFCESEFGRYNCRIDRYPVRPGEKCSERYPNLHSTPRLSKRFDPNVQKNFCYDNDCCPMWSIDPHCCCDPSVQDPDHSFKCPGPNQQQYA